MKKLITAIGLLLFGSGMGLAQYTTISATVVDSDSTVWAKASYSWSFQPGPNQSNPALYTYNGAPLSVLQGSGAANGSGVLSISSAIYDVTLIRPIGASYNMTICPNASSKCASINFKPSGGSLSLSSQINAAITAPRFQATPTNYGYNDAEAILQVHPGSTYWNVTSSVTRCYTGSAWGVCSAGGSGSGTVSAGDAGQLAGYAADGTTVSGMTNQAPFITDPPYNAACDGNPLTDDGPAFQMAADQNATIQLPISGTTAGLVQCNIITDLLVNNGSLKVLMNGSELSYAGTGTMIKSSGTQPIPPILEFDTGEVDSISATGTPALFDIGGLYALNLNGVSDLGDGPSGYKFIGQTSSTFSVVLNDVQGGESDLTGVSIVSINSLGLLGGLDLTDDPIVSLIGPFGDVNITGVELIKASIFPQDGGVVTGAAKSGQLCIADGADVSNPSCTTYGPVLPGIIYSAAGTALPGTTGGDAACSVNGAQATVSDATYLNGIYVSGGGNKAPVYCDGTNWQMTSQANAPSGSNCDASTVPDYGTARCVMTLTSAQILAYGGTSATAIQAIAPSVSGSVIVPDPYNSSVNFINNTTPYSAAVTLKSTWGSAGTGDAALECTAGANVPFSSLSPCGSTGTGFAVVSTDAGTGLYLYATSAVTTGDGTITVTIPYRVVPVS